MSRGDKKSRSSIRKEDVRTLIQNLGKRIYKDLDSLIFPTLTLHTRSVKNLVYDPTLRQYVLGASTVTRSSQNIKQIRPFTQLIWLAYFTDKLVSEGKTSTLRDVFYSAQAFEVEFSDQSESDDIITDLEVILSRAREDFNVYPEERSAIFGDLDIEYTVKGYEGRGLNLTSHPDGFLIGPSLSTADFIDTSAEIIIAVEKGGLFTRFVEEKVHDRFKAIIIDTAGQPPRSTRYMLKRLSTELKLPLYVMTDGDIYGEHIAMVIISGSANAAHLRDLAVPTGKWIGVWGSDIIKYKLPSIPLSDIDIKRVHELKRDPRYSGGIWARELDVFLKIKKKSELEAFAKYGLTAIVDKYLPQKLEEAKSY
ncbi:MAG: DNA topoisomerase IV subunit A [Nitrosopumilus sp.]